MHEERQLCRLESVYNPINNRKHRDRANFSDTAEVRNEDYITHTCTACNPDWDTMLADYSSAGAITHTGSS